MYFTTISCMCILHHIWLFVTPWVVAHQAPLFIGFSKPGFNNTGTMNFQMFKLVLEKAEEPEIKLPTSIGLSKKQEILAPWKKSYDQPRQRTKKQRHYFADKGPSSQSYGFPVVMYGCESWTIKKAECWRIDAFELWCWRVPWTARKSNQSILKEISPECSLEELMLKLKHQ